MPNTSLLKAQDGVRVKEIEQTYLRAEDGKNSRVRRILEDGKISFVKTTKKRISILSSYEEEYEIDENTYLDEIKNRDEEKSTIVKTRYCIPFGKHIIEIDVYPFWNDRAILEVELTNENEEFSLPDYVPKIKRILQR